VPWEEVTGCEYYETRFRVGNPLFLSLLRLVFFCDAGVEDPLVLNLTNRIVFGVRLRSASKGAALGYGPTGSRSKRDDGTGAQWY
jgi:hypothetical protein